MLLVLERAPVEAEQAIELVEAALAQHDVVAGEADHLVALVAAIQDVITGIEWHLARGCTDIADQTVAAIAAFNPVVALVADQRVVAFVAEDDVVADAALDLVAEDAVAAMQQVVAVAAEDDVVAEPAIDVVVAGVAMNDVITSAVADDVVAGAAKQHIVAVAAVEEVVTAITVDGVIVGLTRDQDVSTFRATEHDGVAEEVVISQEVHLVIKVMMLSIGEQGVDVIVSQHLHQKLAGHGVAQPGRWIVGIDCAGLDHVFRRHEDVGTQMMRASVAHDQIGERVVLDLGAEVETLNARQVIEAIAILDRLHLVLKDEVEGGAEQAAEQVLLFSQAADPQVDRVKPGDRARAPLRMHSQEIANVVGVRAKAVHEIVGVLVEVEAPNHR